MRRCRLSRFDKMRRETRDGAAATETLASAHSYARAALEAARRASRQRASERSLDFLLGDPFAVTDYRGAASLLVGAQCGLRDVGHDRPIEIVIWRRKAFLPQQLRAARGRPFPDT